MPRKRGKVASINIFVWGSRISHVYFISKVRLDQNGLSWVHVLIGVTIQICNDITLVYDSSGEKRTLWHVQNGGRYLVDAVSGDDEGSNMWVVAISYVKCYFFENDTLIRANTILVGCFHGLECHHSQWRKASCDSWIEINYMIVGVFSLKSTTTRKIKKN